MHVRTSVDCPRAARKGSRTPHKGETAAPTLHESPPRGAHSKSPGFSHAHRTYRARLNSHDTNRSSAFYIQQTQLTSIAARLHRSLPTYMLHPPHTSSAHLQPDTSPMEALPPSSAPSALPYCTVAPYLPPANALSCVSSALTYMQSTWAATPGRLHLGGGTPAAGRGRLCHPAPAAYCVWPHLRPLPHSAATFSLSLSLKQPFPPPSPPPPF